MVLRDTPKCFLEPIDLHEPEQAAVFLHQRVQCGWDYEPSDVARWCAMADAGTKSLFWILQHPLSLAEKQTLSPATAGAETARRAVGHISLQSVDDYAEKLPDAVDADNADDPPVARPDKSVLTMTTFFIDPAHRGAGLGRAAVRLIEALARVPPYGSPTCHTLTVHTTSRRYTEDDGPAWRGLFARRGKEPPPRGSSTEDWYARMGYVKWKEAPRYVETLSDGTQVRLLAVYMRKTL